MDQVPPQPTVDAPGRRRSIFTEVGLVDEVAMRRQRSPAPAIPDPSAKRLRPARTVRFRSKNDIFEGREEESSEWEPVSDSEDPDYDSLSSMKLRSNRPTFPGSRMYRACLLVVVLALLVPMLNTSPIQGRRDGVAPLQTIDPNVAKREDTNTQVCKRWGHQCKAPATHLPLAEANVHSDGGEWNTLHLWRPSQLKRGANQ